MEKKCDIDLGIEATKQLMDHCLSLGFNGFFEISTEESIRYFSPNDLQKIINSCLDYPVKYVVIQSGTSLIENRNNGNYNQNRLKKFIEITRSKNLLSKEHNGDYIDTSIIRSKIRCGLDAINIAPEFGCFESLCYINNIKKYDLNLLNTFYTICYNSGQWKKWVSNEFDFRNRENLIVICGHYVLNSDEFCEKVKSKLPDISQEIKNKIKDKILSIYSNV